MNRYIRYCAAGLFLTASCVTAGVAVAHHSFAATYDSEKKDLSVSELSEQGRSRYTTLNRGVQIDRATFDASSVKVLG